MKYYTMVEMAKIIGIPESTARGYRDRFPSYMTTTGQGRGKRYTEEAMEALRIVATMSREGIPNEDIGSALETRFGVVVESRDSQPQTVASSQQIVADQSQVFLTAITDELTAMREEIKALQAQLESRDESRDQRLVAVMREIQEMRQEMRQPSRKGFWARLFGK